MPAHSDPPGRAVPLPSVKLLIAGGFGVGKTTLVGTASEITPLRTEERLSSRGIGVDDLGPGPAKATTTVAMDFGRITFDDAVVLLFGTPGQDRFWFMWRDLVAGAAGAVVLADTRRLDVSFAAVDFFETRGVPYVIAANCFDGRQERTAAEIAHALKIDPALTPVLMADARDPASVRAVLVALLDRAIARSLPAHT
ncbi:GTP-binding protein [Streptomyces sp. NPDC018045]|uniref:GTP-binding protein n=1 Tax=Streptomyces sp. NPDC018045 TaxID=3365037 RepID=UPI00378F3B4D